MLWDFALGFCRQKGIARCTDVTVLILKLSTDVTWEDMITCLCHRAEDCSFDLHLDSRS